MSERKNLSINHFVCFSNFTFDRPERKSTGVEMKNVEKKKKKIIRVATRNLLSRSIRKFIDWPKGISFRHENLKAGNAIRFILFSFLFEKTRC